MEDVIPEMLRFYLIAVVIGLAVNVDATDPSTALPREHREFVTVLETGLDNMLNLIIKSRMWNRVDEERIQGKQLFQDRSQALDITVQVLDPTGQVVGQVTNPKLCRKH